MSEETIRSLALAAGLLAFLLSVRNFLFLHFHLKGSILIDFFTWLLALLGIIKPRVGNLVMKPGKGNPAKGVPDGEVIIKDADGNVMEKWPGKKTPDLR